jgi:hypothetical protein
MKLAGNTRPKGWAGWQRTFAWPLLLAVLSAFGLVLALLGDGVWDAASWLLLTTPIAAVVWALVWALVSPRT